jgi:hypothetical protein
MKIDARLIVMAAALVAFAWSGNVPAVAATQAAPTAPSFGANVYIFDPSMAQSQIQATLDSVSGQQVNNQFGTQRYALLFKPGTYGSTADPLVFQVGYYTSVAGLGLSPNDVVINGAIVSFNQCFGLCTGLNNFWWSVSNLTLNIVLPSTHPAYAPAPPEDAGCANSNDLYAISQAAPIRRVHVNGLLFLFDYCNTGFTSGGFIADSEFTGSTVVNGSQQQFVVRNSQLDGWTNAVWNQVFSGDTGNVPAQTFPKPPFTTLPSSPVTREAPFLYLDAGGNYNVLVPAARRNSSGTTWSGGSTPGNSIPINDFFVAQPGDTAAAINAQLASGKDLILTPGIYHLNETIEVTHPDTVVLGLGFPTLIPDNGNVAMRAVNAQGDLLSGLLFDAGAQSSKVLLQLGSGHEPSSASDPRCCRTSSSASVERPPARRPRRSSSTATTRSWTTSGPGAPTMAMASAG